MLGAEQSDLTFFALSLFLIFKDFILTFNYLMCVCVCTYISVHISQRGIGSLELEVQEVVNLSSPPQIVLH